MREETITYKIYKFEELSEEVQQKVIDRHYDWIMDSFWYEHIADEIYNQGGKLVGFALDGGSYCEIKFDDVEDFAKNIIKNHGKECETFKTSQAFLDKAKPLYDLDTDDITYEQEQELEELEREYIREIQEDYRIVLSKEYEYLTSDEAIRESLICMDREFTADGEVY